MHLRRPAVVAIALTAASAVGAGGSEVPAPLAGLVREYDRYRKTAFYSPEGLPREGSHVHAYIAETGGRYTLHLVVRFEGPHLYNLHTEGIRFVGGDDAFLLPLSRMDMARDRFNGRDWVAADLPLASGVDRLEHIGNTERLFRSLMDAPAVRVRLEYTGSAWRDLDDGERARLRKVGSAFLQLFAVR